ncbi:RHS repeat-associated core domain-containing protein, partial [Mycobacterium tuberculosis]|nr:RHS repeat-associated core domain-containing protein [Mycobacterium tuberculosis]
MRAADDGGHQNHITYDSYGNVVSQSNAHAGSRYMYTGREYDAETGLQYSRARYYDPTLGRFLSEDPIPASNM